MKKISKIVVVFATLLLTFGLIQHVNAVKYYKNPNYGLGMPTYGTFLYFDDVTLEHSTVWKSATHVYVDEYAFSVQNANVTINSLFESSGLVEATVTGTSGTESLLTIDASTLGYIHKPETVTYTGDVNNLYYLMKDDVLQLYATHNTDGTVYYEIDWEPSSTGGGGGGVVDVTPDDTDTSETPATEQPQTWVDNPFIAPIAENFDIRWLIVGAALVAVITLCVLIIRKGNHKSTKQKYGELINVKPKKR